MTKRLALFSRWALTLAAVLAPTACVATEADVPADPTVAFPAWTAAHNQTQTVRVAAPPGWKIDRVEYSVNDGPWLVAAPAGADAYTVALTNLGIGTDTLALRVTSSYRAETQVSLFYSTMTIDPVFDCATPATSMLPTPTLIRSVGTEVRTLVGYFGDPARGHSVAFALDFTNVPANNPFHIEGSVTNYGRDAVTAQFNVSQASCPTNPGGIGNPPQDCNVTYALTAYVDGKVICTNPNFGVVTNYAP
jgi:hypothetical protein